tara:strand:+ start:581 stop:751 length:171 start_codon:yes stop_codon:yes gene_type:complete
MVTLKPQSEKQVESILSAIQHPPAQRDKQGKSEQRVCFQLRLKRLQIVTSTPSLLL